MSADYDHTDIWADDDTGMWADDDAELDEDDLDWPAAKASDEVVTATSAGGDGPAVLDEQTADERSFWSLFRAPD